MAVNLGGNLFNAFTERLDSSQTANMAKQQQLRKQAKEDALDAYDRERINNINPNGVRDVDREGFDKRLQQIQQFYQQNKDKIRKAGTPESYNYEKMFREVGGYVNQSKERTAKQDAAMKLYQERLKQDGRIPDDFINELGENDMAIDADVVDATGTQRKAKSLELAKWLSQPKPFNQQNYLKSFVDIKRTPGEPKYSPVDGAPLKMTETIEETFDEGGKQVIAARAADKYQNSFSFAEQVKAEVADPIARKKMEDVFKEQYGTMPAQMEDYATAFTLSMLQPKLAKTRAVDNKEAIMAKQQANRKEIQKIAYNNSLSKMYQYFNLLEASDANITAKADELYNNNYNSRDPQTGEVPTNDETKEAIFGKPGGVAIIDSNGDYLRGVKDATGKITTTGEKVSAAEAKIRIRGAIKNNLPKKVQPGGSGNIRVPKDIKNTKTSWKDRAKKVN